MERLDISSVHLRHLPSKRDFDSSRGSNWQSLIETLELDFRLVQSGGPTSNSCAFLI